MYFEVDEDDLSKEYIDKNKWDGVLESDINKKLYNIYCCNKSTIKLLSDSEYELIKSLEEELESTNSICIVER